MVIRLSVKDQVYDIIKERILRGEYVSGSVVNIAQLTAELEVSNTPIREALSSLESDGLIVKSGSKYNVITLSDKLNEDINEVFTIQMLGAFDLCAESGKLNELAAALRRAYEEQVRSHAGDDFYDYLRKAIEFDSEFSKVSGNTFLMSTFDTTAPFLMLAISTKHRGQIEQNMREHGEILNAVERRDVQATRDLIVAHFDKPLRKLPPIIHASSAASASINMAEAK